MLFRQLAGVPAAAEGADQLHAGSELARLEVGERALVADQGGFGDEHFEVAGGAAFVALIGEVERVLGRG